MKKRVIIEYDKDTGGIYEKDNDTPVAYWSGMFYWDLDEKPSQPASEKVFLPDPPPQDDVQALIRLKEAA